MYSFMRPHYKFLLWKWNNPPHTHTHRNVLNSTVQWQGVPCLQRSHSISPSALPLPSPCELRSWAASSSIAAASIGLTPLCNDTQRDGSLLKTRQISPAVSIELPLASESYAQSLTNSSHPQDVLLGPSSWTQSLYKERRLPSLAQSLIRDHHEHRGPLLKPCGSYAMGRGRG